MGRATPWDPDVDDLTRSLRKIEAEHRGDLDSLLVCRLVQLMNRGSPLRRMSPAPVEHSARLVFADGLSILAHAPEHHGLLRLLTPLHHGSSVVLERVERGPDGVRITLRWGHHRVVAVVTGFDQVD